MRFDLSQSGLKNVITAGIFSLVAIGVLFNWAVPVSAQNVAPAKPDTPTLRALHQGMVEVDWNDVSGANRYEVQFYTSSGWIDLPNAGLGIEIFFYGSRAVATGLPEDLGYDAFHVRAGNSVGWSEWSEYAWQMTTHNMDWEGIPVPTIEPTPEPVNTPATGAPMIGGTAQVGETLTADTSDISDARVDQRLLQDADGLTNVSYSYQWVRNDGSSDTEITDATDSTYTLEAADEGQTIKVKVSFTDDADNDERLTSAATGEVEARPNSPATGRPMISGTAQVGETLTASTSGIADADRLSGATFTYQWVANDGTADTDIQDATGSTYTLVSANEGKTIKVRVSFTDDAANEETLTSTATEAVSFAVQQQIANSPATGAPAVTGTAQVGETLTADTTGIADDDGLSGATFTYQWVANDGTADTDIQDATGSTYTLVSADESKALKVRVSFTDDVGNDETLTSASTAAVAAEDPPAQEPPAQPTGLTGTVSHDAVSLNWDDPEDETITGYQILRRDKALHAMGVFLVHVDDTRSAETTYTDTDVAPSVRYVYRIKTRNAAGLSEQSKWFNATTPPAPTPDPNSAATGRPTISGTAQVGETLTTDTSGMSDTDGLTNVSYGYQWIRNDGTADTDITDATDSSYTLVDADEGKTIKVKVNFADDAGNGETSTSTATGSIAPRPNSPATGAPTITGTAQVGETLTADTTGIADADGLTNVSYSYQWVRNNGSADTDIQDATGASYTLVAADEGKTIKVKANFTDDAGNDESLTSAATAEVAAAAPTDPPVRPRNLTGTANADGTVTLSWDAPNDDTVTGYQIMRRSPTLGEKKLLVYVNDTGSAATEYTDSNVVPDELYAYRVKAINPAGLSIRSEFINVTTTQPAEPEQNNPATGAPTITGTANVGETLTTDTDGIADTDGLNNVSYGYQWVANDGTSDTDISGATDSTHLLSDADLAHSIKVRVSFSDDDGYAETLTSAATAVVVRRPNVAATGQPTITGTVKVGETLTASTSGVSDDNGLTNAVYSYQWVRSTHSTDRNISEETGSTYTIVAADDGKSLKVRVSFTDDDGHAESLTSAATATVAVRPNTPATGAPTISGTPRMGDTLTAETSGIADADGLSNATFTYQWIRTDGTWDTDIHDATDSSYVLVVADEYKALMVQVSFTDDEGNDESLTSAATKTEHDLPDVATRLVGRPYPAGIELQWDAPEGEVTGYQILRRKFDECEPNLLIYVENTGNADTVYMDTDVIHGVFYKYRVKAINSFGTGYTSNQTTLLYLLRAPPIGAPPAPTYLEAWGTHEAIQLVWGAPDGDVTGYQILRRRPEECESALRIHVANTNSTATQWWDEDVQRGTWYQYSVKAINDNGIGSRSWEVDLRKARAVTAMSAVRGNTSIRVGESSTFSLTVSHLHRDDDPNTLDYILRGDVVAVLDDGSTSDADQCEGDGLGNDIPITVVDAVNTHFEMTFGGGICNTGTYTLNVALSDGDGQHIMTMPINYEVG